MRVRFIALTPRTKLEVDRMCLICNRTRVKRGAVAVVGSLSGRRGDPIYLAYCETCVRGLGEALTLGTT